MKRLPLSEATIGATVVDGHGNRWTVAEKAEKATLRNDQGRELSLSLDREVNIDDEDVDIEEAEYMIATRLKGEKVAVIGAKTGKHYAPATFEHVGSLLAHLKVVHGLDVSAMPQTMAELKTIHSTDHSERAAGMFYIEHYHNDAKFERRENQ